MGKPHHHHHPKSKLNLSLKLSKWQWQGLSALHFFYNIPSDFISSRNWLNAGLKPYAHTNSLVTAFSKGGLMQKPGDDAVRCWGSLLLFMISPCILKKYLWLDLWLVAFCLSLRSGKDNMHLNLVLLSLALDVFMLFKYALSSISQ